MNHWRKDPPTHTEWLEHGSNGHWWIKYSLVPEETEQDPVTEEIFTWPEVMHTEIVQITDSFGPESKMKIVDGEITGGRLVASTLRGRTFYLDDQEAISGMLWQPVAPPINEDSDEPNS